MLDWQKKRRYCGYCGAKISGLTTEASGVKCENCGNVFFPQLSPAIIVAIRRGGEIILAHNDKFRTGLYSLIAGFVEAGETLEQAVEREVEEEIGIKVKNIHYIQSQSWPFPNSLMLGFEAEYESGDIRPDGVEITDAKFFRPDRLPLIPDGNTISRYLIDKFVSENRKR